MRRLRIRMSQRRHPSQERHVHHRSRRNAPNASDISTRRNARWFARSKIPACPRKGIGAMANRRSNTRGDRRLVARLGQVADGAGCRRRPAGPSGDRAGGDARAPRSRSRYESAVACPARSGSQSASGVTNGSRARDRRTGPQHRRRAIQIRVRHRDRVRQGRRRGCRKIPSASSRRKRTSRPGCWNGGWRPIAAG